MIQQFTSKWIGVSKGSKTNAMSPLCWITGFLELLLMYGFLQSPNFFVQIWCGVLMTIGLLFICGMFLFFAYFDPDRLQSEAFLIEKQTRNSLYETRGSDIEAGIFFNSEQLTQIQSSQSVIKAINAENPKES